CSGVAGSKFRVSASIPPGGGGDGDGDGDGVGDGDGGDGDGDGVGEGAGDGAGPDPTDGGASPPPHAPSTSELRGTPTKPRKTRRDARGASASGSESRFIDALIITALSHRLLREVTKRSSWSTWTGRAAYRPRADGLRWRSSTVWP